MILGHGFPIGGVLGIFVLVTVDKVDDFLIWDALTQFIEIVVGEERLCQIGAYGLRTRVSKVDIIGSSQGGFVFYPLCHRAFATHYMEHVPVGYVVS